MKNFGLKLQVVVIIILTILSVTIATASFAHAEENETNILSENCFLNQRPQTEEEINAETSLKNTANVLQAIAENLGLKSVEAKDKETQAEREPASEKGLFEDYDLNPLPGFESY